MKSTHLLFVFALLLSLTQGAMAQDNTLPHGVQEMLDLHQKLTRFKETGEAQSVNHYPNGRTLFQQSKYVFGTDGSRFFQRFYSPSKNEMLMDLKDLKAGHEVGWDGQRWLQYGKDVGSVHYTPTPSDDRLKTSSLTPGSLLHGRYPGDDSPWWETLSPDRATWKSLSGEVVNNQTLQVFEATLLDASYRFWVHPETHEIHRVLVHKTGDADYYDRPLSKPEQMNPDEPARVQTEYVFEMSDIQYKDTAAGRVQMGASWVVQSTYAGEKPIRYTGTVTRNTLEVNPDFHPEDFVPVIPNGTLVQMMDEDPALFFYTWEDGKVAAQANEIIIDEIEKPLAYLGTSQQPAITTSHDEATTPKPESVVVVAKQSTPASSNHSLHIALGMLLAVMLAALLFILYRAQGRSPR